MVRCAPRAGLTTCGQASRGLSAAFDHHFGSLMRLGLRPGRSGRRSAHHRIARHRTRPVRGSAHRGHHPHHDHHGTHYPALATPIGHHPASPHPATRHAVPLRHGPGAVGLGCRHGRRWGRGCGQSRDRRRDHSHREQHSGQNLHGIFLLPGAGKGACCNPTDIPVCRNGRILPAEKQYTDHLSPKIVSGRRSCDNSCHAGHPTQPDTYLLRHVLLCPARSRT